MYIELKNFIIKVVFLFKYSMNFFSEKRDYESRINFYKIMMIYWFLGYIQLVKFFGKVG